MSRFRHVLRIHGQRFSVRIIPGVMTVLLLALPAVSRAQSFAVHGSAGPTMSDPGYSLAAGLEFAPTARCDLITRLLPAIPSTATPLP